MGLGRPSPLGVCHGTHGQPSAGPHEGVSVVRQVQEQRTSQEYVTSQSGPGHKRELEDGDWEETTLSHS